MSNDHYVPQFYLRNFSPNGPEGGNIRLINLIGSKFIESASIKGQCKQAGFHDYKSGVEAALGQLEGLAAIAIKGIIEADVPPKLRSHDHETLAVFTIIQRSRTLSAAENADKMFDRMLKVAYEEDLKLDGINPSDYNIKSEHPVAIPLSVAAECAPITMQLGVHVFVNDTSEEFIISDSPVVAHNKYCEGIDYRGVLGWNCTGIQILFPISPRHLVLFYDTKVYAVGTRHERSASRIVDVEDVRNLNAFQIVAARENIYFRNAAMAGPLLVQMKQLDSQRRRKRQITVQTKPVVDGDGTSEIIHQFERMLALKFCVNGVRIKRNMKPIPLAQRAAMVRASKPSANNWPATGISSPVRYAVRRSFSD